MTYNEKEILDNDKQIEQPQKTITNKLRAMLDERGVNWDYGITGATTTKFRVNGVDLAFMPMRDGFVCTTILTPEQVIAATLGHEEKVSNFVWHLMAKKAPEHGENNYIVMDIDGGLCLANYFEGRGYTDGYVWFRDTHGNYHHPSQVLAWAEIPLLEMIELLEMTE